jgi:membrane associated rhomboid family serine protease
MLLAHNRRMTANDNIKKEPVFNLPPVVQALCLLNIGVFALQALFPRLASDDILYALAFVPARYSGATPFSAAAVTSPLTHMFVHANPIHLSVNVLSLMAFGAGIEKKLGGKRTLFFYFACGLCGAIVHAIVNTHSGMPMIGASGAISGLFGGIIMLMFEAGMMGGRAAGNGFSKYKGLLPVIAIWIGSAAFFGIYGVPGVDNPIAWDVHIGGFVSGLLLYKPFSRLKILP